MHNYIFFSLFYMETWSLAYREDRVLRNIFGPTTGKATGGWGRLLNEELQNPLQILFFVCFWRNSPQWARASSFTRVLDHTQRRTTVGRTPLDE